MKKGFTILKFKKDKPIFEVKNLSKSFDGRPILKKLSLKVYPGECVGILGPNGCGKTTLFSICIGEESIDEGKIFVNGESIEQIPIHLRSNKGLGYLPQQRSVFNMSVFDNILGIAQISIKGALNQKAATEKLLDEFNLQHLRSLNASVLSGGEIRRLMMARVMINKPRIVLLDEPLAALDPLIIQDIQKYIVKIQSSGTAILVTDHNVKNLFDITDRSYVLGEQSVLAEGTSRELLKSSKAIEHYFGTDFKNNSN
jgi:lipopolysaccharide export system ATP-binding protein